jgi:hypothetical protein
MFFKFKKNKTARSFTGDRDLICWGINDYPGHHNDLNGCVNDAKTWKKIGEELYGCNTQIFTDQNVKINAFKEIVGNKIASSKAGNFIGVTFSGHGTNEEDMDGDEPNKLDEALCMYDGLIIDDDLRAMLKNLNPECSFLFVADCCHSGTITRNFLRTINNNDVRIRYMPPEDVDDMGYSFGFRSISNQLFVPEEGMQEILLSGCKDHEYSYDAVFNGVPYGAMTYFSNQILRKNPNLTYEQFHDELMKFLPSRKYPQSPQLEGKKENREKLVFS